MSKAIRHHIDSLIAKGVEFQVGLRGSPQPIGPAKVEAILFTAPDGTEAGQLYRMLVQAQMQANKSSRASSVILPVVFDADDVVIVIEAPQNVDGEAAIITPGGNGRTPGGLHIPGG